MNKITNIIASLLIVVMQFIFMLPVPRAYASSPVTVDLGTSDSFAAFAAAALTDTGAASLIVGNVGLTPGGGTSYSGLTSGHVTGTIYAVDAAGPAGATNDPALLTTARANLATAYGDADGRTPDITFDAGDNQLGGQTLTEGVYAVAEASTANIVGTLTLTGDADSVFIFQMSSTLITASSSKVVLAGTVQSCHVFWQVTTSTTLGSSTTFVGNVLTNTTITSGAGSTVDGRLMAGAITGSGALTINTTNITKSTCAAPTATPTPTTAPAATSTPTPTPTSGSSSSSSSSSGGSSSSTSTTTYPALASTVIAPIIMESKRVDAESISLKWGPYSGIDTFNVQYGLENGKWIYNTKVTGFSTTLNALPSNQPIWVQIAAYNGTIGNYGEAKLVGGPSLPDAGSAPHRGNIPQNIAILVGIVMLVSVLPVVFLKKRTFSRNRTDGHVHVAHADADVDTVNETVSESAPPK